MRKKLLLAFLAVFFLPLIAYAQGSPVNDTVTNQFGLPVQGVSVTICTSAGTGQPCTPLASIYSDQALTQALPNPLTTNSLGQYSFWIAPGLYIKTITGMGIAPQTTFFAVQVQNAAIKPAASDAVRYVSINGNDSFDGLSWGSAFLTVAAAETACGVTNQCKIFIASTFSGTIPATPTSANITIVALGGAEWLNSGTFTNTQQNNLFISNIGGVNIGQEFSNAQGGNFATEGSVGAVNCSGAVYQCNGVSAYVVENSSSNHAVVAAYGQARAAVNSSNLFGSNYVVNSTTGLTGILLNGNETDLNVKNTTDVATTYSCSGAWSAQPSLTATCFDVPQPTASSGGPYNWIKGLFFHTGATLAPTSQGSGIFFNPVASGLNQVSQGIEFLSSDPVSGCCNNTSVNEDAAGNLVIGNSKSGAGIKVAAIVLTSSGGGTITHQAPNTASNFIITDPPATGNAVVDSATQTETNKTLTSPVLNTPTINGSGGTLTLPAGPDTLVGRATTDTLTNKTLTSPVLSTGTPGSAGVIAYDGSGHFDWGDGTVNRIAVSLDQTQTLTNKTLTSPAISSPTTTGTDTGTETLTNKTLTSPTVTSPSTTGTDSGTETLTNKTFDSTSNVNLKFLQNSAATNFGVNLSTQTIVASVPQTGAIFISASAVVSAIGTGSCGSQSVSGSISFTAPGGSSESLPISGLSFSGVGILDTGSVGGSSLIQLTAKAGTAITYTTTSSTASCTTPPQYIVYAKASQ